MTLPAAAECPVLFEPVAQDELARRVESHALYAVLDGCGERRAVELARSLPPSTACCLYRGVAEARYWDIAPYLVKLDAEVWRWVNDELWEKPFGLLLDAAADLETLRRHLRQFLMVESPAGDEWYFRFYDPRVVGRFLRALSPDEAGVFFGPVAAIVAVGGGQATRMALPGGRDRAAAPKSRPRFAIRPEVLAAMSADRHRDLRRRLEEHLRDNLDAFALRHLPSGLAEQISAGIAEAKRLELEREIDVARFITVVCRDLGGFRRSPIPVPAQNELLDRRAGVDERLERFEVWGAAWRRRAEGVVS